MPLTYNSRDEHNQRINSALQRLTALTLVPGGWDDDAVNELLKVFFLNLGQMSEMPTEELVNFISRYKVDFENMEHFADVLVTLSQKQGLEKLAVHALGLYRHIQQANDIFSMTVDAKIKALQ